jgi:aminopeptidase N
VVNVDLHDVFYLDSLPSSHPISTVIDNPTYQDNFDRISYGKGSVLIRMIEDFLTTEVFFKALGNYFKVMTLLDSYKNIFTSWTIILYHSSPKANCTIMNF